MATFDMNNAKAWLRCPSMLTATASSYITDKIILEEVKCI